MTAIEKLKESIYNLNNLKNMDKWNEAYFYAFNSFLASTRSILDHLLEDYNLKYNLGIDLEVYDLNGEFHKKSKGNENAEKFIKWYEDEYKKIKDEPNYGFLIKKRNIILHRKSIKPTKFKIGMNFPQGLTLTASEGKPASAIIPLSFDKNPIVKITTTDKQTGEQSIREEKGIPILEYYLDENPNQTIDIICEAFLERLKKMVLDANENF
ncbi:MAG TPA: hypothetical protein VLD38_06035 [Nitrosopumilaceae archaeon]|nr:hypothetical protein [Nitrosopumilaceae archaeon]